MEAMAATRKNKAAMTSATLREIKKLFDSRNAPTSEELQLVLSSFVNDETVDGLFLCARHEIGRRESQAKELDSYMKHVALLWCKQRFVQGVLLYKGIDFEIEETFEHFNETISIAFGSLSFVKSMDKIDKNGLGTLEEDRVLEMCSTFKNAIEVVLKKAVGDFVVHQEHIVNNIGKNEERYT